MPVKTDNNIQKKVQKNKNMAVRKHVERHGDDTSGMKRAFIISGIIHLIIILLVPGFGSYKKIEQEFIEIDVMQAPVFSSETKKAKGTQQDTKAPEKKKDTKAPEKKKAKKVSKKKKDTKASEKKKIKKAVKIQPKPTPKPKPKSKPKPKPTHKIKPKSEIKDKIVKKQINVKSSDTPRVDKKIANLDPDVDKLNKKVLKIDDSTLVSKMKTDVKVEKKRLTPKRINLNDFDPDNSMPNRTIKSLSLDEPDIAKRVSKIDIPDNSYNKNIKKSLSNIVNDSVLDDSGIADKRILADISDVIDDHKRVSENRDELLVSADSGGPDEKRGDLVDMNGISQSGPQSTQRGSVSSDMPEMSIMNPGEGKYSEPRLISYFPPEYPEWAEKRGVFGKVTLKILVNDLGVVTDSIVLKSSAGDKRLASNARQASLKWKFARILLDGKPVGASIRMIIDFKLN